jgi:hydroxymethylglutaryl-CoA lyase
MTDHVTVVEVGARDGLQNEKTTVPVTTKIDLIERLVHCGLSVVEATSFVSPKWIPQLADAAEVMASLDLDGPVRHPVLVPNLQGLQRARDAGAIEIAVFTAASESFSQRNTNCSIEESINRISAVVSCAREHGMKIRGYISCVLGCPYEGPVRPVAVAEIALKLLELGCDEVSLGDTIGVGTAAGARELVNHLTDSISVERLGVHFHDTYGQALANILACLELGVRTVDSSVAGLGGCPYARGATGNVATEDVVYLLHGLGMETGVDLDRLAETGEWISGQLGRHSNSRAGKALMGTRSR